MDCRDAKRPSLFSNLWGECLPGVRPVRYFSTTYPDFSPSFTLSWRSPQHWSTLGHVGINTSSTILLLILITNCDGGALLATQHTHFCLILYLILRGGRFALVSPNMRQEMLPWSVGGVTDLPPNAKLCNMQQNTD